MAIGHCIRARWFYLGKSGCFPAFGCIWAKVVVFVQNGFIRAKSLYLSNVVVIEKVFVFGQSGCIRATWLYSGKVVVFGQIMLYSGKVVVFGQNSCIWE